MARKEETSRPPTIIIKNGKGYISAGSVDCKSVKEWEIPCSHIQKTDKDLGGGSVNHLLCKHKDLSSDPQHAYMKMDVVTYNCNPSTQEAETEEPLDLTSH